MMYGTESRPMRIALSAGGSLLVCGVLWILFRAKGPVVFPYGLTWSTVVLAVTWIVFCTGYTALAVHCVGTDKRQLLGTFLFTFGLLPTFMLLEVGGIHWPAEPGTGRLTMLAGRLVACCGTALGTFALLAVLSGRTERYPFANGSIPYILAGPFTGSVAVTLGAGAAAIAAWIVISAGYTRIGSAVDRTREMWSAVPSGKRTAILLGGLYLFSVAVRVPPAVYILLRCDYIGCGIDYYEAAAQWRDGHLVMPFREPGTSLFFYLAMLVGGKGFLTVAMAQCLVGAAVPVLCFVVARECFPRWLAWSVALIAALYGRLIVYSYFLGSENLQIVTVLLLVWAGLRALRKPDGRRLVVFGMLLAVSALVKPNVLVLAVPFTVLVSWRQPLRTWLRTGATVGACCAAVLALWLAVDYRVSGTFHLGTRFVNEFVLSNHPLQVDGLRWEWDRSRNAYDILREDHGFVGRNPEALENNLFTSGLTTRWENIPGVLAFRVRNAGQTGALMLRKLYQLYFRPFICPAMFDFTYLLENTPYYWFGRTMLPLLALVGVVSFDGRSSRLFRARLWLISVPVCYALVYTVFSPSPRNNMPVQAFLIMFALLGLARLYRISTRLGNALREKAIPAPEPQGDKP